MSDFTDNDRKKLDELLAEAAVRSVVTQYTCAVDWMNWPLLESLFWPDATIDFGDVFRGDRAAFMPFVIALEEGYTRRLHLFSGARIALYGHEAEAEAGSVTHVRSVNGATRTDDILWGRYIFQLARRGDEWRFTRLHYMFSNFQRTESPDTDEGPMNLGDNTSMTHPMTPRF